MFKKFKRNISTFSDAELTSLALVNQHYGMEHKDSLEDWAASCNFAEIICKEQGVREEVSRFEHHLRS